MEIVHYQKYEEVYKSQLTQMVNLATFFLGSRASAEEATHDAFIKLHDNWYKVRNPEAFVKQATVNRCKDILKRRKRDQKRLRLVVSADKHKQPSYHYMVDLLQTLEHKRRFIVVMKYYGGYKIQEIADLLEIPKGTVESNLHRGIEQLRELMPSDSRT